MVKQLQGRLINTISETLVFDLGLARARDPDATTVRVLVVARDLGTHDREWSIILVDRTASRHDIDFTGRSNQTSV